MTFIETLEHALGKKAVKRMLPTQNGDVPTTFADTRDLQWWVLSIAPRCTKALPATWQGTFRTTAKTRPR